MITTNYFSILVAIVTNIRIYKFCFERENSIIYGLLLARMITRCDILK